MGQKCIELELNASFIFEYQFKIPDKKNGEKIILIQKDLKILVNSVLIMNVCNVLINCKIKLKFEIISGRQITPELRVVGYSFGFSGKFGFVAFIFSSPSWITECFCAIKLSFPPLLQIVLLGQFQGACITNFNHFSTNKINCWSPSSPKSIAVKLHASFYLI